MQTSRVPRPVLTNLTQRPRAASLDLARVHLTQGPANPARALIAPAAMFFGAMGLLSVWALAPRITPPSGVPDAEAAMQSTMSHQAMAVQSAAIGDNQALTQLLVGLGAPMQLAAGRAPLVLTATAAEAVDNVRRAEAQMVTTTDLNAQIELQRDRAAFHATGLDARAYMAKSTLGAVLSPLELRDPQVLAAKLDLDAPLARQVQQTARDLIAARALGQAAAALPIAMPVDNPVRSSSFGERVDPFTQQLAFHPGQDFAGHYGQAIHVTAPGVVSFVGQRSGYGNCVEVDHGYGLKTRYGHLSGFTLGVGSPVKTGDVIGLMGSTGRSTGVHLHYEVWASGRLLNPTPFLNAGAVLLRG